MIDIKQLRENPKHFLESAKNKNVEINIDRILELDQTVRALKQSFEQIAAQKNDASKKIPQASEDERKELIEDMRRIDRKADDLKTELTPQAEELDELLHKIPNPALEGVKISPTEDDNEVIKTVGEKPEFDFQVKDHVELGEALGIIDMERAAKASGARFAYLKGDAALLHFALIQYALQTLSKHGFIPVVPPTLVGARAMRAMGYLEHGGHDEIYYLAKDNQYLTGTSEQSIGAMHMDEVLKNEELPLRYAGISTCYRREAGSYGKDTKGLIRVHQFDKVEMFSFSTPETSQAEHELILTIEEELMQGLGLHYQVIQMVTGDLGLPAAKKYDIETWIPSQDTFRETHSTSTCTDFQARRLNTRFKDGEGSMQFVHTVNGTAFAIGRTMVAIIENYQQEDGSVAVPEVLRPWVGKDVITA
ncbi:serine--tRNA ligase [Candidatus Uhrbacteria bacterium]|jgi:seryl-tRNA synthetase|nr:serine--tRNA ligase [Candidatus Uhrbacteria bacterium]